MTDTGRSSNNDTIAPTCNGGVEIQCNPNNQGGGADAAIEEDVNTIEVIKDDIEREASLDNNGFVTADVKAKCFGGFGDLKMAKGYNLLGTARGPIIMSNVFYSTALIYLASEEVGCVEDVDGSMEIIEDCPERVYGAFRPTALITNIAVISSLLAAVFMPLAGALVDYTPHRWMTGVVSAILITLIQMVQIATFSSTWFPMAILQAIAGFLFQVQVLATFAYLPDIKRQVTTETMTRFSSTFVMVQFGAQALFLILVVGISMSFGFDDVMTARVSQAINSVNIIISFGLGWRLMPHVPARHILEKGQSLLWQGFKQNWSTMKHIQRDYKRSIRWYLLGVLFAEPAASAFTVVAVVFLSDKLNMSGTQIGIFFLVVLLSIIPGGLVSQFVTNRTNPSITYRLSMLLLFVLSVIGAFFLTPDNAFPVAYAWGVFVGLMLGAFYPSERLYLSMICPKGQEAELSGFFVYCSQILGWLPSLIFSVLVEKSVDMKYGLICVSGFFLVAVAFVSMSAPFDEVLKEIQENDRCNNDDGGSETPSDESSAGAVSEKSKMTI